MGLASALPRSEEPGIRAADHTRLTPVERARLRGVGERVRTALRRAVDGARYGAPDEAEAKNNLLTLDFSTDDPSTREAEARLHEAMIDYAHGKIAEDEIGPALNAYIDAHRTVWRGGLGIPFRRED